MKRLFAFAGLMAAAVISLTNCQNREVSSDAPLRPTQSFTISVGTDATKTANDGLKTVWSAGDELHVYFMDFSLPAAEYVKSGVYTLSSGEGTTKAEFTCEQAVLPEGMANWYAIYSGTESAAPATPAAEKDGDGYIYIGHSKGITQPADDDMSKLCGSVCPMFAQAYSVEPGEAPSFFMTHIASVVRLNVLNGTKGELVVKSVQFNEVAANQGLAGSYFLDITKDLPVLTPKTVINNPWVTVENPVTLEPNANNGAKFYLPVRPFVHSATAGLEVTVTGTLDGKEGQATVNLNPMTEAQGTFTAGLIKTVNVPVVDFETEPEATFIFNTVEGIEALGLEVPGSDGTNLVEGTKYTSADGVVLTVTKGTSQYNTRVWNSSGVYDLRSYKGNTITITAPSGKYITSIVITGSAIGAMGNGSYSSGQWTGKESSVTFAPTATQKINTITVICEDGAPVEYYLNIQPEELEFEAVGGTQNVYLDTNAPGWDLETSNTPGWITVKASSEFKGFTVTADKNESADGVREGWFGVSVQLGEAGGLFKSVKVSQAAASNSSTIAEVLAGEKNTEYTIANALVVAVHDAGCFIQDNTGFMYVYQLTTPSVGDIVNITGTLSSYNNIAQLTKASVNTVSKGNAVSLNWEAWDGRYLSAAYGDGVTYNGAYVEIDVTILDDVRYATVEGARTADGSDIKLYISSSAKDLEEIQPNSKYTLRGIVYGWYYTSSVHRVYFFREGSERTGEAEFLTVDPKSINFTKDGGSQEVAVSVDSQNRFVFENNSIPEWLTVDYSNSGIRVTASPNDGAARSAEIVIKHGQGVLSETLKVSQAAGNSTGSRDVTIDFTAQGYSNGQEVVSFDVDGVLITPDKGTNNNPPKYYNTGNAVRFYGSNSLTVSTGAGTITHIAFTFSPNYTSSNAIYVDTGTFNSPEWTGSANSVTFTIDGTSGQQRIQKLVVTIED